MSLTYTSASESHLFEQFHGRDVRRNGHQLVRVNIACALSDGEKLNILNFKPICHWFHHHLHSEKIAILVENNKVALPILPF